MIRFRVFQNGKPAPSVNLEGAFLIGGDGVPIRSEIEFVKGEIHCKKRVAGPAGLALLWPVDGGGRILLETARLQERAKPYNLHVELVRGRLMRTELKREDWGLFDLEGFAQLDAGIVRARNLLIEALKADNEAAAAGIADKALALAVLKGEEMSLYHAEIFLRRRCQMGGFNRRLFGCWADLGAGSDVYRRRLINAFDFVTVPLPWRFIEPKEQEFNWEPIDALVEWLAAYRIPMKGAPLVSFNENHVPDWLYIWEHDFETVRDLIADHIRRVVNRYGNYIQVWDVVSGLHGENCFAMNFEQLMELTRMATAITKQLAPRVTTIIDLVAPWGEYYATNQRTIPPILYADMCVQSGINFDAFGLQYYFGSGPQGIYVRDMFQISSMIDRFANFGKALHVTGVSVPSAPPTDAKAKANDGVWRQAWNERLQAIWLRCFYDIALSKPFVDTVCWRDLVDREGNGAGSGGLLRADLSPKPVYEQLLTLRAQLLGDGNYASRGESA